MDHFNPDNRNDMRQSFPEGNSRESNPEGTGNGRERAERGADFLAMAAMVLGLVSVMTCITVAIPIIAAPIAIVLALLSRGKEKLLSRNARIGLLTASAALAAVCAMCIFVFVYLARNPGIREEYMRQYEKLYQDMENPEGWDF